MFPSTPSALRNPARGPRQAFSHEEILKICRFYKNLLTHLREVQATINAAIDKFNHVQFGRPTEPLTRLLDDLTKIEAGVKGPLFDEIMQVEIAAMKWELKSSKLRSEAKRQARIRAERRGDIPRNPTNATKAAEALGYDEFGPIEPGEAFTGDFGNTDPCEGFPDSPSEPPSEPPGEVPMSPTMQRALKGMQQLPTNPGEVTPPDTSGYRKSGLV